MSGDAAGASAFEAAARLVTARAWVSAENLADVLRSVDAHAPGATLAGLLRERGLIDAQQAEELRAFEGEAVPQTVGMAGGEITATAVAGSGEALTSTGAHGIGATVSVPAAPASGRFGRYELRSVLGRGGMGVVHLAWDPKLRREVALKTLSLGSEADPVAIGRFLREGRTAASLQHPGIVAIHEIGEEGGVPYFAMTCIRGSTLGAAIADARFPGIRDRVAALHEIAEAVAYAHGRGVVHRDLKPANILVDEHGGMRILDFGLAKKLGDGTQFTVAGSAQGTPHYMPPEQVEGDPDRIGPASDVYALGAMLYQFLAGRPPFEGGTVPELLVKTLTTEPRPPRQWEPRVPADLETVCLKALAKKPADRFPTAREFGDELARWLRGEAILSRPPTRGERMARWLSRRRAVVVPVAIASTLALVAGLWGWRQSENEARAQAEAADIRSREETNRRAMLGRIRASVLEYEDTVMRLEMSPEVRHKLASPSLEMIDELIAQEPGYGPAYAWRGHVLELVGRELDAESDFDRACRLAADSAVVWYLRGVHRLEKYERARSLPAMQVSTLGVVRDAPAPESEELKLLRDQGLADLRRMSQSADRDPLLGRQHLKLGEALVALRTGGDAQYDAVLTLLQGQDTPKARRMRGLAFYLLGRFDEARAELSEAVEQWPCDPLSRRYHGKALQILGSLTLDLSRAFEHRFRALVELSEAIRLDPAAAAACNDRGVLLHDLARLFPEIPARESVLLCAVADFDRSLRLDPAGLFPYNNRALALDELGTTWMALGRDPDAAWLQARADYTAAIQANPRYALALANRGSFVRHRAAELRERGGDPRSELAAAIADLDLAVVIAPEVLNARLVRAQTITELGDAEEEWQGDGRPLYARVTDDMELVLGIDPTQRDGRAILAQALWKSAKASERHGADPRPKYRQAARAFDDLILLEPDQNGNRLAIGSVWMELSRAERKRGGDPYEAMRNAVREFGEALRIEPGDWVQARRLRAESCEELARMMTERGENPCDVWRMAIADRGERVRHAPHAVSTWGQRGDAYMNLGKIQGVYGEDARETLRCAVADFEAAGKVEPEGTMGPWMCSLALALLAQVEAVRGDDPLPSTRRSIDVLEALVLREPENGSFIRARGGQWLALGKILSGRKEDDYEAFSRAVADFGRIGGPAASDDINLLGLAEANEGLGNARRRREEDPREQYAAAIRAREALLARDPGRVDVRFRLGYLWWLLGMERTSRKEDPGEEYRHAEENLRASIDAGSVQALQIMAVYCINQGRWEEAGQHLSSYVQACPDQQPWVEQMRAEIANRRK